jgi:hypothetical protein
MQTVYPGKKSFGTLPVKLVLSIVAALLVLIVGYIVFSSRAATTADINSDGQVNTLDLSIVLSKWGTNNTTADVNSDGVVNVNDLSMVLSNWGVVSAPAPIPGSNQTYIIDDATRTMTINPVGDYTANLKMLVNRLATRADKSQLWTLRFMPGTYQMTSEVKTTRLENVHITSVDTAQPAHLRKVEGWNSNTGMYLFRCEYCAHVRISYLQFTGLMTVYNPNDTVLHWPDQGVYYASSHNMRVDHSKFYNIGNAAVRTNTLEYDPILGVNSSNSWIEDNYFENVWQITTTSEGSVTHGATRDWWFQRNTIKNLRGSVKNCSRTAGAYGARILNNSWLDSTRDAIELCSVNKVEIRGNTFQNTGGFLVSGYTNNAQKDGVWNASFPWAQDITFAENVSTQSRYGLRLGLDPYTDGYQPVARNLVISNNRLSKVTATEHWKPVFQVEFGPVIGATVTNNTLSEITNGKYWGFASGSSGITIQGNSVNGASYNQL